MMRSRLMLTGLAGASVAGVAGCGSGASSANLPTGTVSSQLGTTPGCGQTQAGVSVSGMPHVCITMSLSGSATLTVHQGQFLGGASSCSDFAKGTGRIESTPGGWDVPEITATNGGQSVQETYTISSFHGPGTYTIQAAQGQVSIGGESYAAPSVVGTVNPDGSGSIALANLTNGNGPGGSTLTANGTITWTCTGS
jgi:hypothetical protein